MGLGLLDCILGETFVFDRVGFGDADLAFEAAGRLTFGVALGFFAITLCFLTGFCLEGAIVSLGFGGLSTGSDLRIFRDLRLSPLYTRT